MPYVNIPESQLSGAIAKLVGKIEGEVSGKVLAKANEIQNSLRQKGCSAASGRTRNQLNKLSSASSVVDNRLNRFKRLPNTLKGPLSALKVALKIILSLPIPQSVPPGFGLPINITTKYADIMHLLKEFIKQIGDDVKSIEYILKTPAGQLQSVKNILSRVDTALKSCEIQQGLQSKLDSGEITRQQLIDLGLLTDDDDFIFSRLTPQLIDVKPGRSVTDISKETGLTNQQVVDRLIASKDGTGGGGGATGAGGGVDGTFGNDVSGATSQILQALQKLEGSSIDQKTKDDIKSFLDSFTNTQENTRSRDSRFFHTGPDGTVYELKINLDPQSPKIAPRRFAVAINPEGVEVFKGQKSFSSSIDILLDEIKFRIDNQLS